MLDGCTLSYLKLPLVSSLHNYLPFVRPKPWSTSGQISVGILLYMLDGRTLPYLKLPYGLITAFRTFTFANLYMFNIYFLKLRKQSLYIGNAAFA